MAIKVQVLSLVLCLFIAVSALAATADDFKIITTDELKAMLDAKKSGFMLIDTRTKEEYEDAHIMTAVNLTEKSFEHTAAEIIKDKNTLLIMYCSGVKCGKSKRTAKIAQKMGYTNLAIYNDGFPVWEERGYKIVPGPSYEAKIETAKIKPEALKKIFESGAKDYVLIDARDETEFKEGHIPSAINIPANTIASKQDILPKDKKIIVYCNTGSRSYMAYRKLMRMEYKNLYQTLFAEWKEAGLEVEK